MEKISLYDIKRIIKPYQTAIPTDDFRIIDSWTEFEEDDKVPVEERALKYLCYELETVNPDTGEHHHFFKALQFVRVRRLPKGAKQSLAFMDMQTQILSGIYESEINLVTIIANVKKPVPLGLLFLYGVQGIGNTIDEAKEQAHYDFLSVIGMLQATFRVLELKIINAQETEWLRSKMYGMDFMTVVRGIPKASQGGEDAGNKGFGGANLNPNSQGTLEELIIGLVDYEYVLEVISTPVHMNTIKAWSIKTQTEMTDWYTQLQGQTSLSANISIPMMYGANSGTSSGWSQAYTDAESINYSQSESFTNTTGESLSQSLSQSFGTTEGVSSGISHSVSNGSTYSISNGITNGVTEGITNGVTDGASYGLTKGVTSGNTEGLTSGITNGVTEGVTSGVTNGVTEGITNGITKGTTEGVTSGTTSGNTLGISQTNSVGNSVSEGFSTNSSMSESTNTSVTTSEGSSYSQGNTQSNSFNHSVGTSQSVSETNSSGTSSTITNSESKTIGSSLNISNSSTDSSGQSVTNSDSSSYSNGYSSNYSSSVSNGMSSSASRGFSVSNNAAEQSIASGLGNSTGLDADGSDGASVSLSSNGSMGVTSSNSASQGYGSSNSESFSSSISTGNSYSHSVGTSVSSGATESTGVSTGTSQGITNSISYGVNSGSNESYSTGSSSSLSETYGTSMSVSNGVTTGQSVSNGYGSSLSYSDTSSYSEGVSQSVSNSESISNSMSESESTSLSASNSLSNSTSLSASNSASNSSSLSESTSTSKSDSVSTSNSLSSSTSISNSKSVSQSVSQSESMSKSSSVSDSTSYSKSQSVSNTTSYGITKGTSTSISNGTSSGKSTGNSFSTSNGTSGTVTSGISSSLGLGPSIGYSKSHQWINQSVKDILELLEFQNERAKKALRGEGAFYTYVYLACSDMDALATAQAVAKSTWQNEFAMVSPLQVLNLDMDEQKHLLYHFAAFSSDVTKEVVEGKEEYKYATLLLSNEFVSYTHLPRVSAGGVYADVDDIPKFAVPSMLKGEIYMGTILSPEHYTIKKGNRTDFDYRIDEAELMHGFFTGASRSGKTVAAMRFISELANIRRKLTGKRLRIVCMDPKQDWRGLARFVEPERFNFYSLGNLNFRPIKLNPWKIPKGVYPQIWIDGVIDIYCRAYGLLERGKQMMAETIYALYEEAGVFKACDKADWRDTVPELSKKVNFTAIQKKMENTRDALESPTNTKGRMGNDTRDAYARLLERMSAFAREFSIEHIMFGTSEGMGVDELIGDDDVTVLESKGLENTFKNFIFGVITSGFYKYALANEGGYLAPDQYETVLVIEEANEILTGNDAAGSNGKSSQPSLSGQSEFEQILDQAAGYGLFIFAITQKIADMPSSIIANSNIVFSGKLKRPEDVTTVVRAIAREDKFEDRDLVKWFPRSPTGWFVCQSSRGYDFKSAEPILVQIARLNMKTPSNAELDEILVAKEAKQRLNMLAG